jgi:hypothetical protein
MRKNIHDVIDDFYASLRCELDKLRGSSEDRLAVALVGLSQITKFVYADGGEEKARYALAQTGEMLNRLVEDAGGKPHA